MALMRYHDWKPFREMAKLFEDWTPSRWFKEEIFEPRFPSVDVEDTGASLVVTAELPGIDPKDVGLELHGDTLIIKGEKGKEIERKDKKFYYKERSFGSFSRSISLGEEIDPEDVEADFSHGLLKVTLKKSEAKKAKKIPIKVKK